MIGLVIVTHGRLAAELRLALEHVVGPQRNLATVCIGAEDDTEACRAEVCRCVEQVDTGDGAVLLTDMFGGTPSNLCIAQMARGGVEVLGGVNLPMLVKLAKVRSQMPLGDAIGMAQAAGRKYIASASDVLPHCRTSHNGVSSNGVSPNGVSPNGLNGKHEPPAPKPGGPPV
jgi:PTS system mannose-specific IIA component